jgi:formate/nitrite transporter FocA (FNT family)
VSPPSRGKGRARGAGSEELDRASLGLTFSGFAAGLNISFSAVALAVVGALTDGVGLAAYLVYPLGFLIIILGKAQLYTENTVMPVTVALTDPRTVPNMLRFGLWFLSPTSSAPRCFRP